MAQRYQYVFKIDAAFTPSTIPMARLAEYMSKIAAMLGNQEKVHFVRLEHGSTALVNEVEHEAFPKVRERVQAIRANEGPDLGRRAFKEINTLLAWDNASAVLIPPEGGAPVIEFPGRAREKRLSYGPFNQDWSLDGILIRIGGENDPVPIHIQESEDKPPHICEAKRTIAIELAPYYLRSPIRVHGHGRWFRDEDGEWAMKRFTITDFKALKTDRFRDILGRIRALNTDLVGLKDPVSEFVDMRRDD